MPINYGLCTFLYAVPVLQNLLSPPTSYESYFLLEFEGCTGIRRLFLTRLAHDAHNNPSLRRKRPAGGSRCFSTRWRQGSASSADSETAGGAEGLSYESEGWEHKWWRRDGGDGGVTAEWAYLSAQPLFSILICKSSGTFDKPVLENRNRCHKTPLRTAFACVTTPPVVPGVPTNAVRHATRSLLADGKRTLLLVFPANNVAFYFPM